MQNNQYQLNSFEKQIETIYKFFNDNQIRIPAIPISKNIFKINNNLVYIKEETILEKVNDIDYDYLLLKKFKLNQILRENNIEYINEKFLYKKTYDINKSKNIVINIGISKKKEFDNYNIGYAFIIEFITPIDNSKYNINEIFLLNENEKVINKSTDLNRKEVEIIIRAINLLKKKFNNIEENFNKKEIYIKTNNINAIKMFKENYNEEYKNIKIIYQKQNDVEANLFDKAHFLSKCSRKLLNIKTIINKPTEIKNNFFNHLFINRKQEKMIIKQLSEKINKINKAERLKNNNKLAL